MIDLALRRLREIPMEMTPEMLTVKRMEMTPEMKMGFSLETKTLLETMSDTALAYRC